MKSYYLLLTLFIFSFSWGQEGIGCKTDKVMKEYWETNPGAYQKFLEFNNFSERLIAEGLQEKAAATYTIPVVFHVYGTVQSGSSVTYNTIVNSIGQVNEEFQGLNPDFNTIDPLFDGIKSSLNIEFKLATIDPDGNATNGVVFHAPRGGYGNNDGGTRALIAQDAWDNYKYMNVYIQADLYNDGGTNNSGVAWYPSAFDSDDDVARIVYNGRYLTGNTSHEFSSTLTHEFGHWLNLVHTHDGGCGGTDYVNDTPQEDTGGGTGCNRARNCNNEYINHENYMGYNGSTGCYKMFTQGQISRAIAALQHSTRFPLWQPGNLNDTGTDDGAASIAIETPDVIEAIANDGSIEGTSKIVTLNTTFNVQGTLAEGVHYTTNLPAGLGVDINVNASGTEAIVSYTGTATAHGASNSTQGTITFAAATVTSNSSTIGINFEFSDPYQIIYVNNPNLTANSTDVWKPFTDANIPSLGGGTNYGGLFYNASGHPTGQPTLQFETYTEAMITNGNSRNVSVLALNTPISNASNWTDGGGYPDLHDIRSSNYNDWNGQTAYAGFRFKKGTREFYGWLRFQVNGVGDSYTLLDYAYTTEPSGTILAGQQQSSNPYVDVQDGNISEASINNGTLDGVTIVEAHNTMFNVSGILSEGTHYTANIPSGLNISIEVNASKTQATVTYTGSASSHTASDSGPGTINFTAAAIQADVTSVTVMYEFLDPFEIIYVDNDDLKVTASDVWKPFTDDNIPSLGGGTNYGGLFYNASGHPSGQYALQFETYTEAMVTVGNTINVAVLTEGTPITSTSNWTDGGGYPDLHDIRSASYTAWNGQTAFAGFRFKKDNKEFYGWFRFQVNASGDSYSLLDYAYSTEPSGTILAGQTEIITNEDTEAPSAPANLSASGTTTTETTLTWDAATDNVGVVGYEVYQDGTLITTVTTISYGISDLSPDTAYVFVVKAIDEAGNTSVSSNEITVTTLGVQEYCTIEGGDQTYEWIAEVTIGEYQNASGASGYTYYSDDEINIAPGESTPITLTPGFRADELYDENWSVWVDFNADGDFGDSGELVLTGTGSDPINGSITVPEDLTGSSRLRVIMNYRTGENNSCESFDSGEVEDYLITFEDTTVDTQAPSVPTNLIATGTTTTTTTLSWDAATDNVGVTGYDIYQGPVLLGTVTETSQLIIELDEETSYAFTVHARDEAGNISGSSNTVVITTLGTTLPDYCIVSTTASLDYYYIENVTFGTINNTSVLGASNGYSDYTDQSTTVTAGSTETLSIGVSTNWDLNKVYAYIDWNKDGDFTDAGEQVFNGGTDGGSQTVTVPATAVPGPTVMRVRVSYYLSPDPCEISHTGEIEDYKINVNAGVAGPIETNIETEATITETIFKVYPNPIQDQDVLQIILTGKTMETYKVYNVLGQVVQQGAFSKTIDVSQLESGMYIIELAEEGSKLNTRFIKQ